MKQKIDDVTVGSPNKLKRKRPKLWFLKLVLRITTFVLAVRRTISKIFGDD